MALAWFLVPYTWQQYDGHGFTSHVLVESEDAESAREFVAAQLDDDAREFWGAVCDSYGDSDRVDGGDSEWYRSMPCDCGDNDCADESDPHPDLDVVIRLAPTSEFRRFDTASGVDPLLHTREFPDALYSDTGERICPHCRAGELVYPARRCAGCDARETARYNAAVEACRRGEL